MQSDLQNLSQKIGELESEADEHGLVLTTLEEALAKDPSRKCFRLIGGVLVERTVKDVVPALQTNREGVSIRSSQFDPSLWISDRYGRSFRISLNNTSQRKKILRHSNAIMESDQLGKHNTINFYRMRTDCGTTTISMSSEPFTTRSR